MRVVDGVKPGWATEEIDDDTSEDNRLHLHKYEGQDYPEKLAGLVIYHICGSHILPKIQ